MTETEHDWRNLLTGPQGVRMLDTCTKCALFRFRYPEGKIVYLVLLGKREYVCTGGPEEV